NNPVLSTELAAYSNTRKWFDVGKLGQKSFGIDQLITLAGKRNKRVLLAKEQTNQARLSFYELMRSLKYELRQNFYTVIYANELVEKFDDQMQLLQKIIDAYDVQAAKKNVPLKDAVRLKTEYIQLSADRNAIVMESIAAQQTLRLLIDTTAIIIPVKEPSPERTGLVLPGLLEKAQQSRSDLRLQESLLKEEELNYKYQKALAIPDIAIGAGYDQSGSYVNNFYSVRAAIDLPLFTRNQGNIKAAGWQIKTAELARNYKQNEVAAQVIASFSRLEEAEREYQVSQQSFNKDFPEVNRSVIENFNKGNISLLEFIDFFENYNSAIRQVNQLQKQRRLAWEELEYAVGAPL
ncbi:MAG TPA: TolC family protein, partial [Agriterribacter sp.]|nr:TolC family protein [Agriterribacter sp.]